MNYMKFIKEVEDGVRKRAGRGANVIIKEIKKNNGVSFWGILAQENDCCILPVIYLEPFYQSYLAGAGMEKITEEVYQACLDGRHQGNFDISMFNDYERINDRIMFKLINYKMNRELLKETPYKKHLDLAAVFYFQFPTEDKDAQGTILIRNEHLAMWGVTVEEVAKKAYENTPKLKKYKLQDLAEIVREYMPDDAERIISEETIENTDFEMLILGNHSGFFGAAGLLYPNLLKELAESKKSNFVILPSSIHELILVPVSEDMEQIDFPTYTEMIQEVNNTHLRKDEILSDHVYFYDRKTDKVSQP